MPQRLDNSILSKSKSRRHIPAGVFSIWLRHVRHALKTGKAVEVPCGDCRGCCTSSYFIRVRKEDRYALRNISKKLLTRIPDLPKGDYLLGYFENGHCPLLKQNQCSIYPGRPQTCRLYDCRIFAAAGLAEPDLGRPAITRQIARWRFSFPGLQDRLQYAAVRRAARFIQKHAAYFPGSGPMKSSGIALGAILSYRQFMGTPTQAHAKQVRLKVARIIRAMQACKGIKK